MTDEAFASFRQERLEQRRKRPAILIGVASGIVIAAIIGWTTFGKYVSFSNTPDGELPLIRADNRPDGIVPADAGGMDVPDRDKMVYERLRRAGNDDTSVERLLAPSEQPAFPDDKGLDDLVAAVANGEPSASVVLDDDGQKVEVVFKSDEKPPAPDKQKEFMKMAEKALFNKKPASTDKKAEVSSEKPAKAEQKTAAPAKTAEASFAVQLVSTRSRDAAESEWKRLSAKHKEFLGGLPHSVSVTSSDKGDFFRLRAGSFKDKDQAKRLCENLKSKKQECFVVNVSK